MQTSVYMFAGIDIIFCFIHLPEKPSIVAALSVGLTQTHPKAAAGCRTPVTLGSFSLAQREMELVDFLLLLLNNNNSDQQRVKNRQQ